MTPRLAAALLVAAALPGGARPATAAPFEAHYSVYQSGLPVMDVQLALHLTDASYRLSSISRARGIARLFLPSEQRAEVQGGLAGRDVRPQRYTAEGNWRSGTRRTVMDFLAGTPRLSVLEPPEGPDRIPVTPDQMRGTIDTLSALVRLSLAAAATGRCDLDGSVFDGRRRLEWSSRTLGVGPSPLDGVSAQALRCRLESRLVAGFRRGDDPVQAGRPREAEAWIAALGPGLPPMPLRVEFPSTFVGSLRLDLVRVNRSGE
ncbi:DUF3108 domain-containing protein [Roseomonas terrae]|jgi:hypothetical protein|uniref:DUF3108 domain-containing protein n=1 Tax=Neoroseomonas terrae TaxID=424799 RepID=A0ABS5EIU5_9PROT|nr:DUF3108 domain-containing protein [Neoroseomonas terrae]MBR0650954.1 DUF3108 domain-containing protein [Neoroseomonas terrae]